MERAFLYVILGGGVAAGYAADAFVRRGVLHGQLCIISEEHVAPYERPALSKGYLLPEAPARLPSFHCCVGVNGERQTPEWYKEHGIELILGTRVQSADVKQKTLLTANGETISYKYLIVATGSRAMKLEEFDVKGSEADNVCYLRDLTDAERLVKVMHSRAGGNAVVIGGGYIGMECAAALAINKLHVTMVFPEAHLLSRLFTPKIAKFYEDFYQSKGVKFKKGNAAASFDFNSEGQVIAVNLKDGSKVPTTMVLVGIGARPNTTLFEGQLTIEKGGIKVNSKMQSSNTSVYAIGDVATLPIKFLQDARRVEHVDAARKSANHAVSAIMEPRKTGEFDYLPFFYSRVFTLSWKFYGENRGEAVHFGDFGGARFGAYWVDEGLIVGSFLEGGSEEQYEAVAKVVKVKTSAGDLHELERRGLEFASSFREKSEVDNCCGGFVMVRKVLPAIAASVLAVVAVAFAIWYGNRRSNVV